MFELQHLLSDGLRAVLWCDRATCLEQDLSFVIIFVYVMDRYSRLFFIGCFYSLVDVHPVHAFAPEFGQQCRMDIDDPVGKFFYQIRWYEQQKARQYYEINVIY